MNTMSYATLVLAALATARITRLLTTDRILDAPRNALVYALRKREALQYLVMCSWCTSVYVGAAMGAAWYVWGGQRWFAAAAGALAFSHVAGYLASKESD